MCVQLVSGLERRRVYRNNAQVCAHIPSGIETDPFPVSVDNKEAILRGSDFCTV
jgi:hypothetical protein